MIAGAESRNSARWCSPMPKTIEPGPVGDLDFIEEISHAIGCRRRLARRRIGQDGGEAVDTDFHE